MNASWKGRHSWAPSMSGSAVCFPSRSQTDRARWFHIARFASRNASQATVVVECKDSIPNTSQSAAARDNMFGGDNSQVRRKAAAAISVARRSMPRIGRTTHAARRRITSLGSSASPSARTLGSRCPDCCPQAGERDSEGRSSQLASPGRLRLGDPVDRAAVTCGERPSLAIEQDDRNGGRRRRSRRLDLHHARRRRLTRRTPRPRCSVERTRPRHVDPVCAGAC